MGYAGEIYQLLNRGDRCEPISREEKDRQQFAATQAEVCAKTGWQVPVFYLMDNHLHLVEETPQGNFVAQMKWFLGKMVAPGYEPTLDWRRESRQKWPVNLRLSRTDPFAFDVIVARPMRLLGRLSLTEGI